MPNPLLPEFVLKDFKSSIFLLVVSEYSKNKIQLAVRQTHLRLIGHFLAQEGLEQGDVTFVGIVWNTVCQGLNTTSLSAKERDFHSSKDMRPRSSTLGLK